MIGSLTTPIRILIFLVSILCFSYFIHHPFSLRVLAILCLIIIAFLFAGEKKLSENILGIARSKISVYIWTTISTAGAFILAVHYRQDASLSFLPRTLLPFSIVAISIGILEELLFRGWLFSHLSRWTIWTAVLVTSLAHAAYKSVLFLSPHLTYQVSSWNLFLVTFEAGIFLGLTRSFSGSVWPALVAHAFFDLLVYGDQQVPWWVF